MKTNSTKNNVVFSPVGGFKKFILLALALCYGAVSWAQPDFYNSSSGTSYNAFPLNSATNKVQWIYNPGMFNSNGTTGTPAFAGLITHVYWRLGTTASSTSTYTNFTIKLGQTVGTQTAWTSTTYATGMTTVFSQSSFQLAGAAATSWVMVALQTPFVYDPTQSLVFEISCTAGTGNQVAQITNNGSRRIWGASSNTTAGTSFGTGLVDMGFDIVPLNVEVKSLTYPSVICEKEVVPVEITIENTDNVARNNFLVQYKINGVTQSTETHTASIPAGQTVSFTFNVPIANNTPGNFVLSANVFGKNTFVQKNYTVNPSPIGSFVKQGSVFNGKFNSGDALDPDIVAHGDQIRYAIEPPTGYTNNTFGADWNFAFWELVTPNGTSAGASHTQTNPSGGNDGYSSFIPTLGQSDSSYLLRYAIHSLSNGCDAPMIERRVFVAPRPSAAFNATTACEGAPLQFSNGSTISSGSMTHKWHFGDGDSTVLVNPAHSYTTAGTYTATLTVVSNYGYTATTSQQVNVFANPEAEFGSTNVCEGTATPFADGSIIPAGIPVYTWDFGDGSSLGSGPNPTHQYTTPGNYQVTMKVTANGCSDEVTQSVTYAPRPVVDFSFSNVDCNNKEVNFTANTSLLFGTLGHSWAFGDNTTSTSPSPSHKYATFGSINVTLTATSNFGCTNQTTKTLVLKEGPNADLSIANLCDEDDVVFTNLTTEPAGANTTYEWRFSDAANYQTKDVTRNFPSVGAYEVTLVAFSDNGCSSEKKVNFKLDEEPSPAFFADNVCDGNRINFQNISIGNQGNFTSSWNFGGGLTSSAKNPSIQLPVGTHTVELTVSTPSGCEASITKNVTVHAIPAITSFVVSSGQNGNGQMNVAATVTPANTKYAVLWGDGGRSFGAASGVNIVETYAYITDGLYDVQIILDNNGCIENGMASASVNRTSLTDINKNHVNAYPNPSTGVFNVDLGELNLQGLQIAVYAADGQLVKGKVQVTNNSAQLDLSEFAAGIYVIAVQTEEGIYTTRVTLSK